MWFLPMAQALFRNPPDYRNTAASPIRRREGDCMRDKHTLSLVKKSIKQNQKAFSELCNLKAREVLFLCVHAMGNQHDGEDAAQEVFIRMQKNITRLRAPEAFNVWLNRLIYTTCLNIKRDSMKHQDALQQQLPETFLAEDDELFVPQEYLEDKENRLALAGMIAALPQNYRTCVLMHYYQNLSYAQIAEVLDVSTDAVNNNMRMARKYLRQELESQPAAVGAGQKAVKLHSVAPVVAIGPFLALALQESASAAITPSAIQTCLGAAGVYSAFSAAGAAGAAVSGVAVKVAAIGAAAVLAGGGIAYAATQSGQPASQPTAIVGTVPGEDTGENVQIIVAGDQDIYGRVYLPVDESLTVPVNGLGGVDLYLFQENDLDKVYRTARTEEDGTGQGGFIFAGLPDGNYRLKVVLPLGANALDGDGVTTEADADTARSRWVLMDGEEVLRVGGGNPAISGINIALQVPSQVSGRIALFVNGAEIEYQDDILPGVTLQLLDPQGYAIATAPLTVSGDYQFENAPIVQTGSYTLHLVADDSAPYTIDIPDTPIHLYPGYRG